MKYRNVWLWVGLCVLVTGHTFAQEQPTDTSAYKKKKLSGIETDFMYSYYDQTGNNAAVTGGIGTEELVNHTPTVVVKIPFGNDSIEKFLNLNFGLDVYTSASSDSIDPSTLSSASSGDTRSHLNATWSVNNKKTRNAWSYGAYFSSEYDYLSLGAGLAYAKTSKNKSAEYGAAAKLFFDQWTVITPIELRGTPGINKDKERNSYSATLHYSKIVNKRFQWSLISDIVYQQGRLSTPFHRVYFSDMPNAATERLPDNRLKTPIGLRANYFISDIVILRTYYRYYWDDWGLTGNTVNIEIPVKISSFLSVYPFYRYYEQSGLKYFAPYREHDSTADFYTSDYDISDFTSQFYGGGIRYTPLNGLFRFRNIITRKKRKLQSISFRYGRYERDTPLDANIFSIQLKFTDL